MIQRPPQLLELVEVGLEQLVGLLLPGKDKRARLIELCQARCRLNGAVALLETPVHQGVPREPELPETGRVLAAENGISRPHAEAVIEMAGRILPVLQPELGDRGAVVTPERAGLCRQEAFVVGEGLGARRVSSLLAAPGSSISSAATPRR